jgi:hypothetical protein
LTFECRSPLDFLRKPGDRWDFSGVGKGTQGFPPITHTQADENNTKRDDIFTFAGGLLPRLRNNALNQKPQLRVMLGLFILISLICEPKIIEGFG